MGKVAGALPDAGETEIQNALGNAVHASVPPPALVIETFCAAGITPPVV
jgi:hypothetical protein